MFPFTEFVFLTMTLMKLLCEVIFYKGRRETLTLKIFYSLS